MKKGLINHTTAHGYDLLGKLTKENDQLGKITTRENGLRSVLFIDICFWYPAFYGPCMQLALLYIIMLPLLQAEMTPLLRQEEIVATTNNKKIILKC